MHTGQGTARTRRRIKIGNKRFVVILAGISSCRCISCNSRLYFFYQSYACTACSDSNGSTKVTEQSVTYESAVGLAIAGEFRNSWLFTVFG